MAMDQVEQAREDPKALETLYRRALTSGQGSAFKASIAELTALHPESTLLSAWAYRLDIKQSAEGAPVPKRNPLRQWTTAILVSLVLGVLYVLIAGPGQQPPIPIPGLANPSFWLGWSLVLALGVILYLGTSHYSPKSIRWSMASALAIALIAVPPVWTAWARTDAIAGLTAIHLPFIGWAAVGASLALGHRDPARQFSAYILKSIEALLIGGIYLAAGVASAGLTVAMLAVLGISPSPSLLRNIAAWGIGVIPILAVASVYDAALAPLDQDWASGLARILRILTRLMLTPILGLLAVYLLWLIPLNFWQPFQEREILIVYNIAIMAIIALLLSVVPGPDEKLPARQSAALRGGVLAISVLTFLLNLYALAAVASRTLSYGLTPNRHAVLGWNIITLVILAVVTIRVWRSSAGAWAPPLRQSIGNLMVLLIVWALWVLFVVPHV